MITLSEQITTYSLLKEDIENMKKEELTKEPKLMLQPFYQILLMI